FYGSRFRFVARRPLAEPVFELIKHFLAADSTSDRAQEILFPSLRPYYHESLTHDQSANGDFELPFKYLTSFMEGGHDLDALIQETEKVIDIARISGRRPSDQLVIPVLREMFLSGDTDRAEVFVDQLESERGVDITPPVWDELAYMYACRGDWEAVQS